MGDRQRVDEGEQEDDVIECVQCGPQDCLSGETH
jgi:hypothetical protein